MDENKLRFGVGVLVISAVGIFIILVFLFGAFPSVLNRDYALTVVFPSAEGIGPNTPVLRDGVRIGRVEQIELRDEGGVEVTLSMDSEKALTHEYIPQIGAGNLVSGDSKLEFVKATDRQLAEIFSGDSTLINTPYTDGEFLDYGEKSDSLFEMQDDLQNTFNSIQLAGESIATAGQSVNQLAMEVREVIGGADGKLDAVSQEAVKTLQEFQGAMRDVRAIVGDPKLKASIETSMAELPELLQEARITLESTQKTFESFERAGTQFEKVGVAAEGTVKSASEIVENAKGTVDSVGRTARNLEQFTEPLAERGDELVAQVLRSLTSLEGALVQVETFGKTLNTSEGSLKRFLEDEELYLQVRRTVDNIEQATAKIRPILDDVRIFSDKIARDPRELGVRGAITKRPSGTGYK
jgi:phospholipid/cholesterol/gamma-HCH transport system substrate-binding protein